VFSKLKRFFTVGVSNRSWLLQKNGLSLSELCPVATRWGRFPHSVAYLLANWEELRRLISSTKKSTALRTSILDVLANTSLQIRGIVYAYLCEDVVKLIEGAEGESPHPSLFMQLTHMRSFLASCTKKGRQVIEDAVPRSRRSTMDNEMDVTGGGKGLDRCRRYVGQKDRPAA